MFHRASLTMKRRCYISHLSLPSIWFYHSKFSPKPNHTAFLSTMVNVLWREENTSLALVYISSVEGINKNVKRYLIYQISQPWPLSLPVELVKTEISDISFSNWTQVIICEHKSTCVSRTMPKTSLTVTGNVIFIYASD